jgi:hypothetical protein
MPLKAANKSESSQNVFEHTAAGLYGAAVMLPYAWRECPTCEARGNFADCGVNGRQKEKLF